MIRAVIAGRWPERLRRVPSTAVTPSTSDAIPTRGGLSAIVAELATAIPLASSAGGESALAICAATTMTALKSAIPTIALTIAIERTEEARHRAIIPTATARAPATKEIMGDCLYASKRRLCPYAIDFGNGPETDMKAMNVTTLATASANASNPGQFPHTRRLVVSVMRRRATGWPNGSIVQRSRIQHQHADTRHPQEAQDAAYNEAMIAVPRPPAPPRLNDRGNPDHEG